MYTIWKYSIGPSKEAQIYSLPAGAEILSFGIDAQNNLCFWARVNTAAMLEHHKLACVGTGWALDNILNERSNKYILFIGTAQYDSDMWHLFDLGAADESEVLEYSI